MNKTPLYLAALLTALSGPVLAQGAAAPAGKSSDATVQMRAERRAADETFKKGRAEAQAERDAKVKAAEDAALKDPANKGKDPLVVKREARSKAMKAAKPDYDAKMKSLTAERKAAHAATEKKYKAGGK